MKHYAHSVEGQPESAWEPLPHHLREVGELAASFAAHFGAAPAALAMGLLHDIGKTSGAYQSYIRRPHGGPKGPDHSSAGAKEAIGLYGPQLGRLLAFGIAGHHSGLMDGSGREGPGTSLADRCIKTLEPYDGWKAHTPGLPSLDDFRRGVKLPAPNAIAPGFQFAFFIRMLFSCLVDADFLRTEAFYVRSRGEPVPARGGTIGPHHLDALRRHMAAHRRDDTEVNRLRSAILDHANAKAALPPGLFTLTVPTGGGKTLTSLSFALEHALAHGLSGWHA